MCFATRKEAQAGLKKAARGLSPSDAQTRAQLLRASRRDPDSQDRPAPSARHASQRTTAARAGRRPGDPPQPAASDTMTRDKRRHSFTEIGITAPFEESVFGSGFVRISAACLLAAQAIRCQQEPCTHARQQGRRAQTPSPTDAAWSTGVLRPASTPAPSPACGPARSACAPAMSQVLAQAYSFARKESTQERARSEDKRPVCGLLLRAVYS